MTGRAQTKDRTGTGQHGTRSAPASARLAAPGRSRPVAPRRRGSPGRCARRPGPVRRPGARRRRARPRVRVPATASAMESTSAATCSARPARRVGAMAAGGLVPRLERRRRVACPARQRMGGPLQAGTRKSTQKKGPVKFLRLHACETDHRSRSLCNSHCGRIARGTVVERPRGDDGSTVTDGCDTSAPETLRSY